VPTAGLFAPTQMIYVQMSIYNQSLNFWSELAQHCKQAAHWKTEKFMIRFPVWIEIILFSKTFNWK